MDAIEYFTRLFEHSRWATARILRLLEKLPSVEPKVLGWFAHILSAERIWLLRLQETDSSAVPIWPNLSLQDIETLAADVAAGYATYLGALTTDRLDHAVSYRNSKGTLFQNRVEDILTHVALHGAYHRGQIAAAVRAGGIEPVNTDYITFLREDQRTRAGR
jgi:uncharacterized damage-inducible protein DinB